MISQITDAGVRPAISVRSQHQHAALDGAQREDVARLDEVFRLRVLRHRHLDGAGAVGRRDAGRDAFGCLDRHGEVGAERRTVAGRHHRQFEAIADLLGQGQADEAAGVADHEIDRLGRHVFGGKYEVAFILAVFLVDQNDHAPGAQFVNDFLGGGDGHVDSSITTGWCGNPLF
jgi:hypothetical protein